MPLDMGLHKCMLPHILSSQYKNEIPILIQFTSLFLSVLLPFLPSMYI